MKTNETKKKVSKAKYTVKEIEEMAEAYRIYIQRKIRECLYNTEYGAGEGVRRMFDVVLSEFEVHVENFEEWITEIFQLALQRVKIKQESKINGGMPPTSSFLKST